MRHLSFLLLLSLLFLSAGEDYHLIQTIPFHRPGIFTTDNLGNAFVVIENQLLQFGPDGKPKANFSENSLGSLRSVDASNPMKLLLFYPDFARMLTLNSQLSPQSTIYLRPAGLVQPTVVCNSMRDGYWIFDLQDFQLKKLDLNLQIVYQSGNLSQLLGYTLLPDFMLEADNFVYLNNPATGILVFDSYGTYYKTIPLKNLRYFQVIGTDLLYVTSGSLHSYNLKTIDDREILLPAHEGLLNARIVQKELYLLTEASLNFYSF
jgi:hypothetical protein